MKQARELGGKGRKQIPLATVGAQDTAVGPDSLVRRSQLVAGFLFFKVWQEQAHSPHSTATRAVASFISSYVC